MGAVRLLALIFCSFWLACTSAQAERRVALVIGNSAYKNVPKLSNPVNDAALVGGMLKNAGFEGVYIKTDLNGIEMRKALRDFGARAREADVAIIYYAGHGIEFDGTNYLIPTDATLETDSDVLDETVALDRALFAVEPAKQLRLIILDACRDNPFAKTMKRTIAARGIGRGLAKVEPTSPNTMIAFAAKAGSTASDGDAKDSPFATALVDRLPTPGLDLRKAFGFVRDDVLKNTGYTQEPYIYGSLGGDDVALVPAKPVASPTTDDRDATMQRNYELALQIGTKPVWDAFIEKYPFGFYTALAKAQRDRLAAEEARVAATEKAKAAQEEKARLAAEGAKQVEQAKAAQQAKVAEQERITAELTKKAQEEKVAEAERIKAAAQAKAAEEAKAAEAPKAAKGEAEAESSSAAKAEKTAPDEKTEAELKVTEEKVAALAPADDKPASLSVPDLSRALQSELRRVGCNTEPVDGNWNAASQRALELFNKHAGTKLEVKTASADALDAVKAKTSRICPLVCEHGLRADGERCVKITCRSGYRINDDNDCEKIGEKRPLANREESKPKRDVERKDAESAPSKPQASGQMICGMAGCRPVAKGCRLEIKARSYGTSQPATVEVCN
ncbi:caspase family protein [Bradyrhizobium guangzhouense]|uniref:Caspase family protein n=1 Tax=Bradyrhizobium guangzhouense TaxID=1325095 RepID=A0ABY0E3X4_9BRAD|nr:caspase family protein [Bradyrhizobium guangzhouense]RXH09813.1 caspase family protein [Bradyrhizobium guangzhouense]